MTNPFASYRQTISDTVSRRYQRYYTYIEPIITDPVIRSYFSLAASLLLVAFLIVFALSPTINTIVSLRNQIDGQNQIIHNLENKTKDLITAKENYTQVERLIPALLVALPDQPAPQTIVSGVIQAASSSAVTLGNVQFQNINLTADLPADTTQSPQGSLSGLLTVDFSLGAQGSLAQLHSFLEELENTVRYVRIQHVGINISQDNKISANVNGIGFYFYKNK